MAISAAYRVFVTTSKGLNINLSNRCPTNVRTYSHFVTLSEAKQFVDCLESLLKEKEFSELDRCSICGDPFLKKDSICRLSSGATAHYRCIRAEVRKENMAYKDISEYDANPFLKESRKKDYSNMNSDEDRFQYEIEIVSKTAIHLWLRERRNCLIHHFCLSYDECCGLILEVREKQKAIEQAKIGICIHCKGMIYADETHYIFKSGELIHSKCMERFVCGVHTDEVRFPVLRRRTQDLFDHRRLLPELYNKSPFPEI